MKKYKNSPKKGFTYMGFHYTLDPTRKYYRCDAAPCLLFYVATVKHYYKQGHEIIWDEED